MPLRSHCSVWTIPTRKSSHFGDNGGQDQNAQPPQKWGFQAKNDPIKRLFWTQWAPVRTPITKSRRLICLSGPMDPYEPFQPEIPVTLVTLEAKNVPLNTLQKWGFHAKNDPLKRLFWIHWATSRAPSPNLDFGYAPQVPMIHMNHSSQKLHSLELYLRPITQRSTLHRNGDFKLKMTLSSE